MQLSSRTLTISTAFATASESVRDFFSRPGIGYYIPLYQREYSWHTDNVDQLMEDVCRGVQFLSGEEQAIHFMGTIILVDERNPKVNIQPQDPRALPPTIQNVIDGQQRISTIALLACLLYQRITQAAKKLPQESAYEGLREAISGYQKDLLEAFSVDLNRGNPTRKPIIIRGSVDQWTFDGDASNYESDVASYLVSFIRIAMDRSEALDFPQFPKRSLVGKNLRSMDGWLHKVEDAHKRQEDDFPLAWQILDMISEEDLWSYTREDLTALIRDRQEPLSKGVSALCGLVQLFAFCHYLLKRCCFTLIEPTSESWAFDMFQSLNATGTPLTALETFKPLVVNTVTADGQMYKGSSSEQLLEQVDHLMAPMDTAASKSKLTNDFLTTFALTYDGSRLSSQFSAQRQWLLDRYHQCDSPPKKEEFVRRMADLAIYWSQAVQFDPSHGHSYCLPLLDGVDERLAMQATLAVMYLQDAGHKMANTVLSRFYGLVVRKRLGAAEEFASACLAVAAFFTLWRSALPNAGLDDEYRKLLKDRVSWKKAEERLSTNELRLALARILTDRGIATFEAWRTKAQDALRFDDAKTVCRFALFIASHDTVVDPLKPGLMKQGTPGTYKYLEPTLWRSNEFKSIEHVAPQHRQSDADWDPGLYDDETYQTIGNLVLLPTEINSSAGNRSWIEKWIYYRHLAETDPDNLANLQQEAANQGVHLAPETIRLLKQTEHKHHIAPLVTRGPGQPWNKEFVQARTERICEILWERMNHWLTSGKL